MRHAYAVMVDLVVLWFQLPFGVFLASELGLFALNDTNLVILAGVLAAISVAMLLLARATFQREEILTRWR